MLPADLVARWSYALPVIGTALATAGSGAVTTQLGVPAGTMRSWLRRARSNADTIRRFLPGQPAPLWPVTNVLTCSNLLVPAISP